MEHPDTELTTFDRVKSADCEDCDWSYERRNIQATALMQSREHVAETGHEVDLERTQTAKVVPKDIEEG